MKLSSAIALLFAFSFSASAIAEVEQWGSHYQVQKSETYELFVDFAELKAGFSIDPNACFLSEFGETETCTEIASEIIQTELKAFAKKQDRAGQVAVLYEFTNKNLSRFRLVVRDRGNTRTADLLLLGANGEIESVLALRRR